MNNLAMNVVEPLAQVPSPVRFKLKMTETASSRIEKLLFRLRFTPESTRFMTTQLIVIMRIIITEAGVGVLKTTG